MNGDKLYLLIWLSIIGLILVIFLINKKQVEKLNKKLSDEGNRIISFGEIIGFLFINVLANIMMFSMILVLYAQICIDLGLINDGLLELNNYISFIPLKLLNGYDKYSEPIVIFRILDKFHYSGVILVAFILSQISCVITERLVVFEMKNIQKGSKRWLELASIGINVILWFITPFSITISIIFFNIILGINLKIFKIKMKISNTNDKS